MPDQKQPWMKREDETSRAYEAFTIYLGMGPEERSLQAVHDEFYGEGAGNLRYIEKWSSEYDWVSRAEAYDEEVLSEATKEHFDERKQEVKDMFDRQQKVTKMFQMPIVKILQEMNKREIPSMIPDDWDFQDFRETMEALSRVANKVMPLEREARDLPGIIEERRHALGGFEQELEKIWEEHEEEYRGDEDNEVHE